MSDATPFGFGKFVPGFDFLQGLTKSASGGIPHMPQLANWVAPTLSEEELEKRIEELKAVQFWLDQNSRALTATVQALEVQKMTLATLKGMNVHMTDVANAFKMPSGSSVAKPAPPIQPQEKEPFRPAPAETGSAAAEGAGAAKGQADNHSADQPQGAGPGIVDPMQWWGALTQQFQQIASAAIKDAAAQAQPGSAAKQASANASARKSVVPKAGASSKAPGTKAAAGKARPTPKGSA